MNTNAFKMMQGNEVQEVKCVNINKGLAAQKLRSSGCYDFLMVIGDGCTHEDIFETLNVKILK